jgi:protein-S-isoprenylcysteine O-methyltransferase Ste14
MKDTFALIVIMSWPVIPLLWIPAHSATGFFRKLGRLTYLLLALVMAPTLYLIYANRELLVAYKTGLPLLLNIIGLALVAMGLLFQVWTAKLLTLKGITGMREIVAPEESELVDTGPFGVVRHPSYLAHTMIFLGSFLYTGVLSVALLTIVDFVVISQIIIPLEERELRKRLGSEYDEYMKKVHRLIPGKAKKK